MSKESSLAELHDDAVNRLKEYLRTDPQARGPVLRSVAETLVSARENIIRVDGRPDLSGRTPAYRDFVGSIYASAGIKGDERKTVMSAVRHHVANVNREIHSPEVLAEYGLDSESANDKLRGRRAKQKQEREAVQGLPEDARRSVAAALAALRMINAGGLSDLTAEERAEVREGLDSLSALTKLLREWLDAAG